MIIFFLAILVKGGSVSNQLENLFSVSSFLFGIYVAFSISNNLGKSSKINETLKADAGIWLFVYKSSDLFGAPVKKKVQGLIDAYFIEQIDYFLKDFKYSNKSFFKLFDFLLKLKPETDSEKALYGVYAASMSESVKNRKMVETLVRERMSRFEWLSIISLLSVILFFVFYINDGSLISIVSSILLATSAVVLVFVLRDLDNLQWKEQVWIWNQLEALFYEFDLLPYYPKDVVGSGRVVPAKGQKIRLAEYPNPYPDMNGKSVKTVEV